MLLYTLVLEPLPFSQKMLAQILRLSLVCIQQLFVLKL